MRAFVVHHWVMVGRILSPNDAMWLNMDTPENLMVIETVMWCDQRLSLAAVRKLLADRMIGRYPVFTWRSEATTGPVKLDRWVPDEDFDVNRHITGHSLRGEDPQAGLRHFVSQQMSVPLDRDHPLWHAHVINGPDFGALMMRIHHSIGDGAALVEILMDFTDGEPDPEVARPNWQPGFRAASIERLRRAADTPGGTVAVPAGEHGRWLLGLPYPTEILHSGQQAVGGLLGIARATAADPIVPAAKALGVAGAGLDRAAGAADAVDSLVLSHRPDSRLTIHARGKKAADWCPPLSLTRIKDLARRNGATVNDILIAGLAGGLRRYCAANGENPANVITLVPVNLRPPDEPLPDHLGNQFALVALELPVAATTVPGRIAAGKLRMGVIKRGPQALLTYGVSHLVGTVGTLNRTASRQLINFFSNKAIGVTTNVIGPKSQRWFTGARMVGVLGWVPTAGDQSVGVCILSYNDQVFVGFKTDTAAVPDVSNLAAAFAAEMAEMLA